MLENRVSPPYFGTVCRCSTEPIGGSSSQETSLCHWWPFWRVEPASVWTRISSGRPSTQGDAGWMCSSPNRLPNARCCSWSMGWSRKKMTPCASSARRISAYVSSFERLAKVDVGYFRADRGREGFNRYSQVRHEVPPGLRPAGPSFSYAGELVDRLSSASVPSALTTASGSWPMTVSSTRAARSGTRRPCSQSCTARASSPKRSANFCRLSRNRLRRASMRSAAGSSTIRQGRFVSPRTWARTSPKAVSTSRPSLVRSVVIVLSSPS